MLCLNHALQQPAAVTSDDDGDDHGHEHDHGGCRYARFVDGSVPATSAGPSSCPFLGMYSCSKSVCWRADRAVPLQKSVGYRKGALQVRSGPALH